jgi:hypothetical protein
MVEATLIREPEYEAVFEGTATVPTLLTFDVAFSLRSGQARTVATSFVGAGGMSGPSTTFATVGFTDHGPFADVDISNVAFFGDGMAGSASQTVMLPRNDDNALSFRIAPTQFAAAAAGNPALFERNLNYGVGLVTSAGTFSLPPQFVRDVSGGVLRTSGTQTFLSASGVLPLSCFEVNQSGVQVDSVVLTFPSDPDGYGVVIDDVGLVISTNQLFEGDN